MASLRAINRKAKQVAQLHVAEKGDLVGLADPSAAAGKVYHPMAFVDRSSAISSTAIWAAAGRHKYQTISITRQTGPTNAHPAQTIGAR
jgi:hypothetical protein